MNRSQFVLTVLVVITLVCSSLSLAAVPVSASDAPGGEGGSAPLSLDGPVVVRLYFDSRDSLNVIASQYDVWEVHHDLGYAVVMLSPEDYQALLLSYRMEIDEQKTLQVRYPLGIPSYPCYRTVEETYAAMQSLNTNYPALAELFDYGDSWDKLTPGGPAGYDLYALRITNENITPITAKPVFFLMAEIHAREYTTAETAMRLAEYILQNYGVDPTITFFVDYNQIYIVPMTNPDGRKFAEAGQSWRKNTDNDDGCSTTYGTDLNRNWSFKWGCCGGSSGNACAETYRGPARASEPETYALQYLITSVIPDQNGPNGDDELPPAAPNDTTGILITLHSYSRLVLWPWGFTSAAAPNSAGLQTIGVKFATYNYYTPQQSYSLYSTDGTTDDWSYGKLGIPSYTFEMGDYFFEPCSAFENTIWPNNRPALLYAWKIAKTPYMTAYGPDTLNAAVSPISVPQGAPAQLTATINDDDNGDQNIAAAEYFVLPLHSNTAPGDPGTGLAMNPADGAWNSKIENVVATVDTAALVPGDYIIALRGKDANNNWGPFAAVFLTVEPAPEPDAIDLQASAASIPIVYGHAAVTATLTASSAPVVGRVVTFTTDLGSINPLTATTNAQGRAFATLTAGGTPGTANVVAQAKTLTDSVSIEVYTPAAPVAGFTTNSPVCVGSAAVFTNTTVYPPEVPIEYLWNFGDGMTSTLPSPTHLYSGLGPYTVTLTTTNLSGSDDASGVVTLIPLPQAAFTFSPPNPRPRQAVNFYDASSGNPAAWSWNFGDGYTSSLQNPSHIYLSAGAYTVTLRARGVCGWSDYARQTVIVAEPPVANFTASPLSGAAPLRVEFTDTSLYAPTGWLWAFGDGMTSTVQHPVYTYTQPGVYTVTLTVSNTAGSHSKTRPNYITVGLPPVAPVADFEASPLSGAAPLTVAFTDASAHAPTAWAWSFGDGGVSALQNPTHTYTTAGTYTVTLTVTNANGSDSEIKPNYITVLEAPPCVGVSDARITRLPAGPVYVGESTLYVAEAKGTMPYSYAWTVDGEAAGENQSALAYTFLVTGPHTVAVTVTNVCSQAGAVMNVEVYPARPPDQPDLAWSSKRVSQANVDGGDVLTYTLTLRNSSAVTATAVLTDPIPAFTTFVSGSAQSSDGRPVAFTDGALYWSGEIVSGTPVLVEFSVVVTTSGLAIGAPIVNQARLDDGLGNVIELEARSVYNPGYRLTINEGNLFTTVPTVTLRYAWDYGAITHVRFSNDGGFGPGGNTTAWLPVSPTHPIYADWVLATYGDYRLPRVVYAMFRDAAGRQYGPVQDDIIYDPVKPIVTAVTILPASNLLAAAQPVRVRVASEDDNSGVALVQISAQADFAQYASFAARGGVEEFEWDQPGAVYVRALDRAGNVSEVQSAAPMRRLYLPLVIRVSP